RSISVEAVQDLGRLDPEAITQVVEEAQPLVRDADELHDYLLSRILLPVDALDSDVQGDPSQPGLAAHLKCAANLRFMAQRDEWASKFEQLVAAGRATTLVGADGYRGWAAAERLPAAR